MKINKNDLMSDELGKYTMVNGQKQYVVAKKRKLDINTDSNVGRAEFNGNANIGMDYIKPAEDTITNLPKELPGGGPNINVSKSNAYNTYKAKPPEGVKGGGYVAPIPEDIKTKIPTEDYSKMISYEPGQSKQVENKNKPSGFKNFVGGVLNATTELPAMLGKGIATGVGAIAKLNPNADDAAIDRIVNNYKDYVDKDRSNYLGEDQNSKSFTAGAVTANVVPLLAGGAALIGKQGLKQGLNATSAFNNIGKNAGKGTVNVNKIPTYKGPDTSLSTAKADAIKVQEYTKEYNRLLNLKNTGAGNLSRGDIDTFNRLESLLGKR